MKTSDLFLLVKRKMPHRYERAIAFLPHKVSLQECLMPPPPTLNVSLSVYRYTDRWQIDSGSHPLIDPWISSIDTARPSYITESIVNPHCFCCFSTVFTVNLCCSHLLCNCARESDFISMHTCEHHTFTLPLHRLLPRAEPGKMTPECLFVVISVNCTLFQ